MESFLLDLTTRENSDDEITTCIEKNWDLRLKLFHRQLLVKFLADEPPIRRVSHAVVSDEIKKQIILLFSNFFSSGEKFYEKIEKPTPKNENCNNGKKAWFYLKQT